MKLFTSLFGTWGLFGLWDFGSMTPDLGPLHAMSDLGLSAAYLAIACVLGFFVFRRKKPLFRAVLWLFTAFALASGSTHLMEAIVFWWPTERLATLTNLVTAILSWAALIALAFLVPRALAMRSPQELKREIGESRGIERGALVSEQLYRQMTESIREIFWMQEGGWKQTLYMSPAYEEVWGRTCESLYQNPLSWIDGVHPDDRERVKVQVEQQLRGMSTDTEFRVERPDGSLRWVRCHAFPIKDPEGNVSRVAGIAEDITDRKQAQEAFRESEEQFRGTFENAAVGIAHADADGRFLLVNDRFCNIVGYTREELLAKGFQDITHPEDLAISLEKFHSLVRGELPSYSLEKRYLRKDGSVVWGNVSLSIQNRSAGEPTYCIAILQDISELKKVEEKLRRASGRLELAVRSSNIALGEMDLTAGPNGHVEWLNYWEQWGTGNPEDYPTAVSMRSLLHPEDRDEVSRLSDAFFRGEVSELKSVHRVRHRDGSYHWALAQGVLFRDAQGRPIRSSGSVIDINDLKQAEEKLRESEERFRGTFENAAVGMAHMDSQNRCLRANEKLSEILGYPSPELVGKTLQEVVHPDDLEPNLLLFDRLVRGELPSFSVEKRFIRRDGTSVWTHVTASIQRDAAGQPAYCIAIVQDISERKRAEDALRQNEERFRGTFENAAVGIAHKDLRGGFLLVNNKFCDIVGYTRDELLTKSWRDITYPDDVAASVEKYGSLMRGEATNFSLEKRYLRKDHSLVWVDVSVSLQRDAAGFPSYAIAIVLDVSEHKELEGELRRAKDAAEAANRAKDEFLANVSHEIRTPMNAILGMTELTLDTPLTVDQRQYLKNVHSAAESLLGIINDLLDFSKIEAGKLELDLADFSLRAALGETLRALAIRAHKKGLELVSQVQSDVPDALVGDAGRLRQSLLNLIGNAIKFTAEGEVVVRVERASNCVREGEVGLHFTVADTGIGIPPEKQETIFRAFEQEDTSTTRKYGGTGLGLTIAARLVALMGGRITVESQPGRGSTFSFTACFGVQPHQSESVASCPPVLLRNLRALIVDDNLTNRRILEEWLRGWQMEPAGVGDGLTALNALWHAVSLGRPYPLMLLDAHMPDTDGLALAAKLREHNELSSTRIILLTSGQRPGDLTRARQVRINAHLLKPVQQEELLETIYQVMSRPDSDSIADHRSVPAREPTGGLGSTRTPLRILLAEDSEFNAQHLERLLVRRDHIVRMASNGREALALLGIDDVKSGTYSLKTPGRSPTISTADSGSTTSEFDLVLLDLQMPELDGLQVVRAIRESERATGGHVPVIALTARSRKEDRENCLAAGMDDYLSKPIRSVELFAAIDRVLFDHGVPQPSQPDVGEGTSLLDPVVLLGACGDDAEGLREMREGFQIFLPRRLAEVAEALRNEDAPRLSVAAHKLFGLLSAFSTVAGGVASILEDQAASGQLDECRPLVEQLEVMARELVQQVSGLSIESLRQQGRESHRDQQPR